MASASPLPKASMNLTLAAWISACNPATQAHTLYYFFLFKGDGDGRHLTWLRLMVFCPNEWIAIYTVYRSSLLHEYSLLTSHFSFHAQGIISIRQREALVNRSCYFVFSRPLPITLFTYVGGAHYCKLKVRAGPPPTHAHDYLISRNAECAHYVDVLLPHSANIIYIVFQA